LSNIQNSRLYMTLAAGLIVAIAVALGGQQDAQADGSHFIAEVHNGVGIPLGYEGDYTPGYALGVTLGAGGKFTRNPTRFYLIGQFNTSSFSADRMYNNRRRLVERQVTDLNAGLRMLWPVMRRLRVYADLALGVAQIDSQTFSPDLPARFVINDVDSNFALFTSAGLQYRFAYFFSAGTKADFAFIFDDDRVDAVSEASSGHTEDRVGRLNLYLTATFHF
jgi:hypothetical protein